MSLDVKKLEKVRELANGVTQARCPACAEGGGDSKGQHLRIYADGRYGCCVHPKDAQHRKRIFALVGERQRRSFTVKVAGATRPAEPARSVRGALAGAVRTLRTGDCISEYEPNCCSDDVAEVQPNFRTLRTPFSNPRACARDGDTCDTRMYKDSENGVLSVLGPLQAATMQPATMPTAAGGGRPKLPFFTADGTLSIPFDSPERYHWWKPDGERLTVKEIRAEVQARMEEEKNGAAF